MYLPATDGYIMPVEHGRVELQACMKTATPSSRRAEATSAQNASLVRQLKHAEDFCEMKTGPLKALETQRVYLHRRANKAEVVSRPSPPSFSLFVYFFMFF